MKAEFSFRYGEKQYKLAAVNGAVYEVDDGIAVKVTGKAYEGYDAVEWVLSFENTSKQNSGIFSDILDCDTLLPLDMPEIPKPGYMPKDGDACVITMNGIVNVKNYQESDAVSATEFGFTYAYLDKAPNMTKSFANTNCLSSDGTMPFFDATASGNGCIAAIGWTGSWKADFARCEDGIQIKTGLAEAEFYLKPGEKIRTTSILIMRYTAGEDKHNKFRRLVKAHFSHKSTATKKRDGLMAFELWGGLPSEEMKKRIELLKKYDIQFEDVWIDAGWYGNCTKCDDSFSGDWAKNAGEWFVNRRVHPGELRDVSQCAQDAGMQLMFWLEPERAVKGTSVTKAHPDWFLKKKSESKSDVLYYGNEAAAEYARKVIEDYVSGLKLSCYRQDFNAGPADYFKDNDEEYRRGITEIKHITGMYRIWDQILEKFPGLIIDNCCGGGRRIDIETLKRSIPFFRTDYQCAFNENPEVLQTHNVNISRYLPFNGCSCNSKNDTYAIRSSYSSSWGGMCYHAISQDMNEGDFLWLKKITDEYRNIRKYFSMDFYNHGSSDFDDTSWAIWQYHDPDTQRGIVMAFRRSNSPFEQVNITLKGLKENKVYCYTNLNNGLSSEHMDRLTIELPEKRSSVIFEYTLTE